MARINNNDLLEISSALSEYARTLGIATSVQISHVLSDPKRYRIIHDFGVEIVTEDWLMSVAAGRIDPGQLIQEWWETRPGIKWTVDPNVPVDRVYQMTAEERAMHHELLRMGSWVSDGTLSRNTYPDLSQPQVSSHSGGEPNRINGYEDELRQEHRRWERREQERLRVIENERQMAELRRTEEMKRQEEELKQEIIRRQEREIPDIIPRRRRVKAA